MPLVSRVRAMISRLWSRPSSCPVSPEDRAWVDRSMTWLIRSFGDSTLRRRIVLPTHEFFPSGLTPDQTGIDRVVEQVADFMGVTRAVRVELLDESEHVAFLRGLHLPYADKGAGGHYQHVDGHEVIAVKRSLTEDPVALIATVAHELAHVRLIGEGRIDAEQRDQEPLTDLATVVLGMGVFGANASLESTRDRRGWQTRRLGYLSEQMFGYALGRFALLRGDSRPGWLGELDTNPQAYARETIRFLRANGLDTPEPPAGS